MSTTEIDRAKVREQAAAIMAEIHDDMRKPFPWGKQIPRNVGSFSALHDYVDANQYLIDHCGDRMAPAEVRRQDHLDFPHDEPCPRCGRRQWGLGPDTADPMNPTDAEQETCGACDYRFSDERPDDDSVEAWMAMTNAVSDAVDAQLAAEAVEISGRVANHEWCPSDDGTRDYGVIDGDLLDELRDANSAAWHYHHEGPVCVRQAEPATPCDCGGLPHKTGVVGCAYECRHFTCMTIMTEACTECVADAERGNFDEQVTDLREAMVTAAEGQPLPARFVADITEIPHVTVTDTETGRNVRVGLCDYAGLRKALAALFPDNDGGVRCAGCGDEIHTATDDHPHLQGIWWDSSGDDECLDNPQGDPAQPPRSFGPHVPLTDTTPPVWLAQMAAGYLPDGVAVSDASAGQIWQAVAALSSFARRDRQRGAS